MYTTEQKNEDLEDKNIQSSTTPQILKDNNTSEHEETKENVFSETEETKPQMEKNCCPPRGTLNKIITNGVFLSMIWCVTWSISEHDSLPGGNLFGLLIIFYSAIIGGKLVELIRIPSVPQLPSLLGMLLAGFTIRNVPFLSKHVRISTTWSSTLRNIALTVILIRAGLGLDPKFCSRCCLSCCCCPFHASFARQWIWY
ncbi:solute carrier family 9 member B1 [Rhinolophus ferrumequinum]|uniref:Solute carrier family 9 member B1 n=1 Tax=Rhinolophus ferrumequinum TaxID=59479 RepID=A0A7J7ZEK4_RHIFE|nr:solute carrier family 9 member B1 [Rhinolophus ferrumequinum]